MTLAAPGKGAARFASAAFWEWIPQGIYAIINLYKRLFAATGFPGPDWRENMKKAAWFAFLVLLWTGLCLAAAGEAAGGKTYAALRLDPEAVTLKKGGSCRITANVTGLPAGVTAGTFEWTTSDPQVAVYREGSVRAVGGGKATLTCSVTLSDGTTRWAVCPVAVTVPVTSLRMPSGKLEVMAGEVFVPDIEIYPEEAADTPLRYTSSDEGVVRPTPDGRLEAVREGRAAVTAVAEGNPDRQVRMTVNVTRRIGKSEGELTFQGIPWESDRDSCFRRLRESGFIAEEAQARSSYSNSVWHWPENDLLFSRASAWRTLPVSFTDRKTGAQRASLTPRKTVGGYLPQTTTLIFLNAAGADGTIDAEATRLIGVYLQFDNRHEKGAAIFRNLLEKLEEQYGEFTRYMARDIPRYYPDLYAEIETDVKDAALFGVQELGKDLFLGECIICTIRGEGNTGIMLSIDTNETVTLFYGRTDAQDMIGALEAILDAEPPVLEDAGV